MPGDDETADVVCFLRCLRRSQGGYTDRQDGNVSSLQDTVSVLKALRLLCAGPQNPGEVANFILDCGVGSGAFASQPGGEPSAYWTAFGLLALNELGERKALLERSMSGIRFIRDTASSAADHFMLIAAHEECGLQPMPSEPVTYFQAQKQPDGRFGTGVRANAIAAAALLRAGSAFDDGGLVAKMLLSAQQVDGGFGDSAGPSNLSTTYAVMRALRLLGVSPDLTGVRRYVRGLRTEGGYRADDISPCSASATYQALGILAWLDRFPAASSSPLPPQDISGAVAAARRGNIAVLQAWLAAGGNPNLKDKEGWTPLLAAASRGQAGAVEFLLYPDDPAWARASPDIRFSEADALPLYIAGQSGHLETVRILLRARPEHIHEIASVNGHTILLQAAFYGFPEHLEIIDYLLGNVARIMCLPADRGVIAAEQKRLLTATNVRGFNALGMGKLWRNQPLINLVEAYPQPEEAERQAYLAKLLERIAPEVPDTEEERKLQSLSDEVVSLIQAALKGAEEFGTSSPAADRYTVAMLAMIGEVIGTAEFGINRLAGPLQQPPIVVAATGRNANEQVAHLRRGIFSLLLKRGADPDLEEKHPMGVDAVIRAAVLDHIDLLKLIAEHMEPRRLAAALNKRPAVNGQTALHDAVHRALTASGEPLGRLIVQIGWMVERGARSDIEEHSGKTSEGMARAGLRNPETAEQARSILAALGREQ